MYMYIYVTHTVHTILYVLLILHAHSPARQQCLAFQLVYIYMYMKIRCVEQTEQMARLVGLVCLVACTCMRKEDKATQT